ncbi:MAG: Dps family protein, partial [Culicoidibacterales bacterium]
MNEQKTPTALTTEMNNFLANLNVMYVKLHNLHWNVTGMGFFEIHVKLEELYTDITLDLDEVAERILTIGHKPLASLKEYLQIATISEIASQSIKAPTAVQVAIADYIILLEQAQTILALAEATNDLGTQDLMGGLISKYEKTIWMLQAYTA